MRIWMPCWESDKDFDHVFGLRPCFRLYLRFHFVIQGFVDYAWLCALRCEKKYNTKCGVIGSRKYPTQGPHMCDMLLLNSFLESFPINLRKKNHVIHLNGCECVGGLETQNCLACGWPYMGGWEAQN